MAMIWARYVAPVPCGVVMEDLGAQSVDPAVLLPCAASAAQSLPANHLDFSGNILEFRGQSSFPRFEATVPAVRVAAQD